MTASARRALFSIADRLGLRLKSIAEKVRGGPCCAGDVTLLPHTVIGDDERRQVNKK